MATDESIRQLADHEARIRGLETIVHDDIAAIRKDFKEHAASDEKTADEIRVYMHKIDMSLARYSAGMKPWMVILGVLGMALVTFLGSVVASLVTSHLGK